MSLSYDIFDLVEFPIIITDKDFSIIYKNHLATKYFGKLRKRSKINSYAHDLDKYSDFSHLKIIDVETGTQFMRALALELDENSLIFLFLTLLSFNKSQKLLEHIKEKFDDNFVEFYLSAYNEYLTIAGMRNFEKAQVPSRAYTDILHLVYASVHKPDFMQSEVHDVARIVEHIANTVGGSLGALGLKMPSAKISDRARSLCKCSINLPIFSFVIFRMIYTAFKLSVDGTANISLDHGRLDTADVCVYSKTAISEDIIAPNDINSLINLLPEFSLEFTMLQKTGIFGKTLSFSVHDSVLEMHFKAKCAHSGELILRSDRPERKDELIAAAVSKHLLQIKNLFLQNQDQ